MAWYAIYTKSRMEKKVSLHLEEAEIECYCPVTKRKKQWSDRKKIVEEVLFRSYVFVNIDLVKQGATVRKTFGVVNFVYWLHKPALIQDEEILAIKQFLSDYTEVSLVGDTATKVGDFITINTGPLKGQRAEVTGLINKNEVRLRIDSMGFELVANLSH